MKFTKSQKMYLAVLGLGVCALIYDRCFSDAKVPLKQASGSVSLAMDHHGMMVNMPDIAPSVVESDTVNRLQRLQAALPPLPALRDAFIPSPSWVATSIKDEGDPSQRVIKFQSVHRLRAILNITGRAQIIVDNSLVAVGQSLDGFQLTSIEGLKAIFVQGDTQAVLTLETTALSQRAQPDP